MASSASRDDEDDPMRRDADEADADVDNEPIDPRVECLLEQLNNATTQINRMEGEHYTARKQYRLAVAEANTSMEKLYKQSRKAIEKSRPYYDARRSVDQVRTRAATAARLYEAACTQFEHAREALSEAERNVSQTGGSSVDQISLEALNHATELVQESRNEVKKAETEYETANRAVTQTEAQLAATEKQHRKHIPQAELYYSTRSCIEAHLEVLGKNVQALAEKVADAKYSYRDAFSGLETVSDEIHDRRKSQRRLTRRDSGFIEEIDAS